MTNVHQMMNWDRREIFRLLVTVVFLGAFAMLFIPFYAEILLAGIAALAIEPFLGRLVVPSRLRWKPSVAIALVALFLVFALPVSMVAYKGYGTFVEISKIGFQNTEFFRNLTTLKTTVVEFAQSSLTSLGLDESVNLAGLFEEGLSRIANLVMSMSSGMVARVPSLLISLFIYSAALYFFLAEAKSLRALFNRLGLLEPKEASRFVHILQRSCYTTVLTSVLIGVIQATIVGSGAFLLDGGDFGVVWVVTFFCSFIPVVGAGPVALVLGLLKLISADYGQALGFLVVAIVGGMTDNIIRPFLLSSGDQDLHPVVSLLAIIGALMIFGMPGLFLGPVIATMAVKIIPTLYPREDITAVAKDQ